MSNNSYSLRALFGDLIHFWEMHKPLIKLVGLLLVLIALLILVYIGEGHLNPIAFHVMRDFILAIIIAMSAGIVYEVLIRGRAEQMVLKAVEEDENRRRSEVEHMIEETLTKYSGLYDSGLVEFHHSRAYLHNALSELPRNVQRVRVLAIHALRVWKNINFINRLTYIPSVRLEVLLLNPNLEKYLDLRAQEFPSEYGTESIKMDISAALSHLSQLRKRCPHVQVRLYDCPCSFTLVFVDSVLYLSGYLKGSGSQESPVCRVEKKEVPNLYDFFEDYFDRTWAEGVEVRL